MRLWRPSASTWSRCPAITSRSSARADERTTFEASCYTDPPGIEPVTGSLSALIRYLKGASPLAG